MRERLRRWWHYPLRCKVGLHVPREQMQAVGFADWMCPRCGCVGV